MYWSSLRIIVQLVHEQRPGLVEWVSVLGVRATVHVGQIPIPLKDPSDEAALTGPGVADERFHDRVAKRLESEYVHPDPG